MKNQKEKEQWKQPILNTKIVVSPTYRLQIITQKSPWKNRKGWRIQFPSNCQPIRNNKFGNEIKEANLQFNTEKLNLLIHQTVHSRNISNGYSRYYLKYYNQPTIAINKIWENWIYHKTWKTWRRRMMLGWLTEDRKLSSQSKQLVRCLLSLERQTCFTATTSPLDLLIAFQIVEKELSPSFDFNI